MFITIPIKGDGRSWFFLDSPQKVQKVAEMIRQEVFNHQPFSIINSFQSSSYHQPFESWPTHPDEINHENVVFPDLLKAFLPSLLSKLSPISS